MPRLRTTPVGRSRSRSRSPVRHTGTVASPAYSPSSPLYDPRPLALTLREAAEHVDRPLMIASESRIPAAAASGATPRIVRLPSGSVDGVILLHHEPPRESVATPPPRATQTLQAPGAPQREQRRLHLHLEEDDMFEADMHLAIRLSMATVISDDDLPPSQAAESSRTKKVDKWAFCAICSSDCPDDIMCRVSLCCDHTFCKQCILAMFRLRSKPVIECPSCMLCATPRSEDVIIPVTRSATRAIDPHFVSEIDGMSKELANGNQLRPFLSPLAMEEPRACPKCSSFSSPSTDPSVYRCYRNECGHLFCAMCSRAYHGKAPCQVDEQVEKDLEYAMQQSKPCPKCGTMITHYSNHGCHRITCNMCKYAFCYVCLEAVNKDRGGREYLDTNTCTCPVFCQPDLKCGCPRCPDCKPGHPCSACDAVCPACLANH